MTDRRMPVPVTLVDGPAAGTMNLWPESIADEMFLPDWEHARAAPDSPLRFHRYHRSHVSLRTGDTRYVFIGTEEGTPA